MSMTECKECHKEVSTDAVRCPHCGAKLKMGLLGKAMVTVGVLFGLFMLIGILSGPGDPEMAKDRRLIEKCWQDQQLKSLDPSAARYMAGMCEKFESDFRARWNRTP